LDFLVEERLLIEMKSVEQIDKLHEAQLLTYLKLAKVKTGLLFNFNVALLRDGIIRRVL
jgi:GxxExxY protein